MGVPREVDAVQAVPGPLRVDDDRVVDRVPVGGRHVSVEAAEPGGRAGLPVTEGRSRWEHQGEDAFRIRGVEVARAHLRLHESLHVLLRPVAVGRAGDHLRSARSSPARLRTPSRSRSAPDPSRGPPSRRRSVPGRARRRASASTGRRRPGRRPASAEHLPAMEGEVAGLHVRGARRGPARRRAGGRRTRCGRDRPARSDGCGPMRTSRLVRAL